MALPALAIPIGMGVAAAGGAVSRASAARQQAEAMMPDEYRRRLAELERRQRAGTLGLTEAQQGLIESEGAAARGAIAADARAQQLQRAQSQSAGFAGRDLFLADLASQQTQAQMMSQQAQQIDAANERARLEQEQQLLELQQREADAEAARRSIPRQLAADLFGVAASTAGQAFTSAQMAKQQKDLLAALARGDTTARNQAFYGQMATSMAGAFGGGGVTIPQGSFGGPGMPAQQRVVPQGQPFAPPTAGLGPIGAFQTAGSGIPTLIGYDPITGAPIIGPQFPRNYMGNDGILPARLTGQR